MTAFALFRPVKLSDGSATFVLETADGLPLALCSPHPASVEPMVRDILKTAGLLREDGDDDSAGEIEEIADDGDDDGSG